VPTVDVDLGVTCRDVQSRHWWVPLMGTLLDVQKRGVANIRQLLTEGSALTDHNANFIVSKFMAGNSEWLWMVEDDTSPPRDSLEKLLSLGRPFVAGAYYLKMPPYTLVAYFRNTAEDYAKDAKKVVGMYRPPMGWERGEIFEVDSVGMGNTLIHRSVFEKIKKDHILFQRETTGTLVPIHKSMVDKASLKEAPDCVRLGMRRVQRMVYKEPLVYPKDDTQLWPFYAFENTRTQDHWFCELANNVGFKPWLDTSLESKHWGMKSITGQNNRQYGQKILEELGDS
jgi:hypothetical protein